MEKQERKYVYPKGIVNTVEQKTYKDKESGEEKTYWAITLTSKDTNETMHGAIFEPEKFKQTAESMQDLVGKEIQCSYYIDEENKKHVFLFGDRPQKKSFLEGSLLSKNTEYAIKLKKVSVFQSKDSKNIFIKYEMDPKSIIKLCDPKELQAFIDGLGYTQEQAVNQARKKLEDKRSSFEDYDWGLITQISSVGKNKNGKMIQAVKMADGRVFDIIKINLETFAKIVMKNHNETKDVKWSKEKTLENVNKLVAAQDIDGLKKLAAEAANAEVFLNVRNGKLSGDRMFGKVKAYLPKDKDLIR